MHWCRSDLLTISSGPDFVVFFYEKVHLLLEFEVDITISAETVGGGSGWTVSRCAMCISFGNGWVWCDAWLIIVIQQMQQYFWVVQVQFELV